MTFQIIKVDELPADAEIYIEKALAENIGSIETLESLKLAALSFKGNFFLIKSDEEILGAFFANIEGEAQNYINIIALGGRQMNKWKDVLFNYMSEMGRLNNAKIMLMGRNGWGRIYPKLKRVRSVFVLDL